MLVGKLDKKINYNLTQYDCISIFVLLILISGARLAPEMQYKRYFFQYAQPGAYDRLGPARPCRCGVTASDSLIWVDRRHETRCIMGYYSIVLWVDRVGHVVQSS